MPRCLALDTTGRAVAVPLRIVGGAEAVLVMCKLALDSILGDWREDRDKGLPWPAWWSSPSVPLVIIEGEVRRQLLAIEDVIEVREVSAGRVSDQITISILVSIRESEGITLARLTAGAMPPANVPGAWFMVVEPIFQPVVP